MQSRIWWLLGGLAVAVAAFVYSRTQSGSDAVGAVVDKIISTIRGIRNNNPTNLEDAGIAWQGMTGTDGPYCVFDTMENGIRAAAINLRNYWRLHGINTVDGIVRRWSATDQDAYVSNVSRWLGVDPQDALDMEDAGVRTQVLQAMTRQEEGLPAELLIDSRIASVVANV
jgi:hypothetical protein